MNEKKIETENQRYEDEMDFLFLSFDPESDRSKKKQTTTLTLDPTLDRTTCRR